MHACDTANDRHLDTLAEALLSRQVGRLGAGAEGRPCSRPMPRLLALMLPGSRAIGANELPGSMTSLCCDQTQFRFRPPALAWPHRRPSGAGLGGCAGLHPRPGPGGAGRQAGHRGRVLTALKRLLMQRQQRAGVGLRVGVRGLGCSRGCCSAGSRPAVPSFPISTALPACTRRRPRRVGPRPGRRGAGAHAPHGPPGAQHGAARRRHPGGRVGALQGRREPEGGWRLSAERPACCCWCQLFRPALRHTATRPPRRIQRRPAWRAAPARRPPSPGWRAGWRGAMRCGARGRRHRTGRPRDGGCCAEQQQAWRPQSAARQRSCWPPGHLPPPPSPATHPRAPAGPEGPRHHHQPHQGQGQTGGAGGGGGSGLPAALPSGPRLRRGDRHAGGQRGAARCRRSRRAAGSAAARGGADGHSRDGGSAGGLRRGGGRHRGTPGFG